MLLIAVGAAVPVETLQHHPELRDGHFIQLRRRRVILRTFATRQQACCCCENQSFSPKIKGPH